MWVLYYTGIGIYIAAVHIASLFSVKARLWVKGRNNWEAQLIGKIPDGKKSIWMHCASLGEFEMGRPVLETIRKEYPEHLLVLTFFSPSGYEVRKHYPGADLILYLPADFPGNARRFYALIRPQLALFVKYEFWFGYLKVLHKNKTPVMLISGRFRPEQHFFRWYGSWFYRKLFYFNRIHLQDNESANLAGSALKARVIVSGDTRYDRVKANAMLSKDLPEISRWLEGRKCMVAGSTWPVDDELMLPWKHKDLALIIAPHEVHPQRIRNLKQLAGHDALLYSELSGQHSNILIIDNIGMLLSIYALGQLAYVGGGFGSGLHNILEPAAFGLPVIFGPDHKNFPEAAALEMIGAARSIRNRETFDAAIAHFNKKNTLESTASVAKQFVSGKSGATSRIMETVRQFIS
jgi:3-deoxy-D-manno-octulosonic-acid transferase